MSRQRCRADWVIASGSGAPAGQAGRKCASPGGQRSRRCTTARAGRAIQSSWTRARGWRLGLRGALVDALLEILMEPLDLSHHLVEGVGHAELVMAVPGGGSVIALLGDGTGGGSCARSAARSAAAGPATTARSPAGSGPTASEMATGGGEPLARIGAVSISRSNVPSRHPAAPPAESRPGSSVKR
jgi:hypothetical protein